MPDWFWTAVILCGMFVLDMLQDIYQTHLFKKEMLSGKYVYDPSLDLVVEASPDEPDAPPKSRKDDV